MEVLIESLLDALQDTWLMIPLLYIAYIILEYFERRPESEDDKIFVWLQKYGPLFGACLGLLPQCGFSILAAMLFCQNYISLGTLAAVFIATSDEAIPVLISEPAMIPSLVWLLILKLIIAVCIGFLIDKVLFKKQDVISIDSIEEEEGEEVVDEYEEQFDEGNTGCPCCYPQYPIWLSALLRTGRIYLFIFITTVLLNIILEMVGADTLSMILLKNSLFQPLLASLIGFIPNCAATVVLCQLYAAGQLSFASLLAGLITNSGMGILCLFNYGCSSKNLIRIITILLATALVSGILVSLI